MYCVTTSCWRLEAIDRMYLNVYVPHLQTAGAVVGYLHVHRGQRFASTTAVVPMSEAFVRNIEQFVADEGIDLVSFAKGERKDDVTQKYLRRFHRRKGVLYVGKAQEKARVMRTERRRSRRTGGTYPWIVESTAMVNHYYFYCVDEDFGPFFLKFCSYFPYNAKLDAPVTGRVFFEEVIRENLDLGRPSQVALVFDRRVTRRTPGRFRTRVITDGVVPSLHVDYKKARIKQYHKEGQALRTETTINDTRDVTAQVAGRCLGIRACRFGWTVESAFDSRIR